MYNESSHRCFQEAIPRCKSTCWNNLWPDWFVVCASQIIECQQSWRKSGKDSFGVTRTTGAPISVCSSAPRYKSTCQRELWRWTLGFWRWRRTFSAWPLYSREWFADSCEVIWFSSQPLSLHDSGATVRLFCLPFKCDESIDFGFACGGNRNAWIEGNSQEWW